MTLPPIKIKYLTKWIKEILKKNIFIHTIFALPFHFHPLKYLQNYFLSKKYSYKNLENFSFKKNIVIVGSGPSLDEINLSAVRNSTVIFLNGSVRKYENFDKTSNNFLWYAQDINGVNRHISTAQFFKIKKVFTIGIWNTPFAFKKHLSAEDVFFLSRASFRRDRDYQTNKSKSFYSFRPEYFGFDGNGLKIKSLKNRYLHSLGSVIFSAISFSLYHCPKNIVLIGFDAPTTQKAYKYAIGTRSPDQIFSLCQRSSEFNEKIISHYLASYKILCEKMRVSIFNYSPLTNENILPKICSDEQLAETLKFRNEK